MRRQLDTNLHLAALATAQHGVVARSQLLQLGLTASLVAAAVVVLGGRSGLGTQPLPMAALGIVLALAGGVSISISTAAAPASAADRLRDDLLSALQNLGYHRPLAEKAADAALAAGGEPTFEIALKAALRELMRSR